MRILAFSDLHRDLGQAAKLVEMSGDADVVIGAGDFASIHEGLEETIGALTAIGAPSVLVPGNNETADALREAAAALLAACPAGAVMVLHSPPRGHCDAGGDGTHFGSPALLAAIEEKRPRLAVCGHIHESWGCESEVGGTPVRNLGPAGTWIEV